MQSSETYYWINEKGIPVDIDTMPYSYLKNCLKMVVKASRLRASVPDVTSFKIGRKVFFAPIAKKKNWLFWKVLFNFVL